VTALAGPRARPLPRALPPAGLDAAVLFGLAFALRIGIVLTSRAGIRGVFGYDPGVYYASAAALADGRLPYRDFVLLHPPAITLVLTPFALLGRFTTDHTGYIVANTAFTGLGAANAALVAVVARRFGAGRGAALLGGAFYAVWFGAVISEVSVRLEPLGGTAFLCGLLGLASARTGARRHLLLAGVGLGFACCVKIWWVVPLVVVVGWLARTRGTRPAAGVVAAGAVGTAALVAGPFFALAPRAMAKMVVVDQLGRHATTSPLKRITDLATVRPAAPSLPTAVMVAGVVVVGALFVVIVARAWRVRPARVVIAVLVAQLLVLGVSPVFFRFYAGYPAGALAVVVALAGAPRPVGDGRDRARWVAPAAVATATVLTAAAVFGRGVPLTTHFPEGPLAAAVRHRGCVISDSPSALIQLDVLSRDLSRGCPNWVDVTGRSYDIVAADGSDVPRRHNRQWQREIRRYLLSGDVVILVRFATGLARSTRRAITARPVVAAADGYVIYAGRP
jgi:alpha-1,2-mannosyltransferase